MSWGDASILRLIERDREMFHAELAEIREGLAEIDHAKASRAQLRELHSRVDRQSEDLGQLDDAVSSLRNDYRGVA